MIKTRCKHCECCKQIGRAQPQKGRDGRKMYYCVDAEIKDMTDKWGFPRTGFIGFGEHTYESQLKLKTSPKWCPRRDSL